MRKLFILLIILMGLAYTESTRCRKNGVAYNRCGDRCLCTFGRLTQCARIRRDFISMKWSERLRFVRTFLTATQKEPYKSVYERLVATHTRNFRTGIHTKEQFLPWHRWYLLQMENLFRRIDCRVTVPYWDWSLFSGTPWRSTLNDFFSSAPWGFGGNGGRGNCVTGGPFNRYHWQTTASNHRQCLKRRFNGNPPDIVAVAEIMKYNAHQFNDFELGLRDTLHDNMHCRIGGRGGTMCSLSSANAPEFLLHHGFTDKLWSDWQKKGWDYKNAYFKWIRSIMTDTGLRPTVMLDLNQQPGGVRVIYKDPTHSKYQEVHRYLQQLTLAELKAVPRHRFTITQSLEFRLFMVKSNEKKKAQAQQRSFEPRNVLGSKTRLASTDMELGFRVHDLERAVKRKREIEEKRKREMEEKRKREIEKKKRN